MIKSQRGRAPINSDPWLIGAQDEPTWRLMTEACNRVKADRVRISRRIVDSVYREIPEYRTSDTPRDDVVREAERHLCAMLDGIAARRSPTESELQARAEIGRRRADQGVPAGDLLRAFHIGYRELWNALTREAEADPSTAALLLRATGIAWSWVQVESTVATEAHKEASHGHEIASLQRGVHFLDQLLLGDPTSVDATSLAGTLGFDPDDDFVGVCVRDTSERLHGLQGLRAGLGSLGATCLCIVHGGDMIVLAQANAASVVVARTRELVPEAAIGVGLVRSGLQGAKHTVIDAQLAAQAAQEGSIRHHQDVWFGSLLRRDFERVEPMVAHGMEVAAAHPHLVEALRTYLDVNLSKARAAQELFVHPHTISYRLDRWRELTGWDVDTARGMLHSMAVLDLLDVEDVSRKAQSASSAAGE